MKWLEVIKLRSAGKDSGLLEEFLSSIDSLSQDGPGEIRIYHHAVLETDLSLHIRWEAGRLEQSGSALGLRLAHALKEFGLTDHSVWTEKEK